MLLYRQIVSAKVYVKIQRNKPAGKAAVAGKSKFICVRLCGSVADLDILKLSF